MLTLISNHCKTKKKMCKKAIDFYLHSLLYVPDCYTTQEMCSEAVDT